SAARVASASPNPGGVDRKLSRYRGANRRATGGPPPRPGGRRQSARPGHSPPSRRPPRRPPCRVPPGRRAGAIIAGAGKRPLSTAPPAPETGAPAIDARVDMLDWSTASADLDAHGWALLDRLLMAAECDAVAELYDDDVRFRSHIVMARHGFGRGEYKYFTHP